MCVPCPESSPVMKEKAPLIILLATTLGLGIFSIAQHNGARTREAANTALHQKQVKEFEGRVSRLVDDLRNNGKELSQQANEANSLKAKLIASESTISDTVKKLENAEEVHDMAQKDVEGKLKLSQQELLDTKANVAAVEAKLNDKVKELGQLMADRAIIKKSLDQTSGELADATARLKQTGVELSEKSAALVAALKELEDGQVRIAKLETDLQAVNQQVGGLRTQIGSLEQGIETTQKKLDAAVGDRAFLLRELKRMQDEKAELEKHLNNLEYVRAQYKKLKSEWVASERLRRIREGIGYYGHPNGNVRGVTSLRRLARRDEESNASPQSSEAAGGVSADQLNVELRSDGTVTIVEPGERPKVVKPEVKAIESTNPADGSSPQPGLPDNPKGVVTPAPESVLPKLESNPNSSKINISPVKPTPEKVNRVPKTETPVAPTLPVKPSPSKIEPAPADPVTKPKFEKPTPAPKPVSKPSGKPAVPDNQ